jgi:hypothetical protein
MIEMLADSVSSEGPFLKDGTFLIDTIFDLSYINNTRRFHYDGDFV